VHEHEDLGRVRLDAEPCRGEEIAVRIGGGAVGGALGSHQHNGAGHVPEHEGEGGGGIAQGVRPVGDDHPLRAGVQLVGHRLCQGLPAVDVHVLAEQGEDHPGARGAYPGQLRDGGHQLLGSECGVDRPGAVVHVARDRAPGPEEGDGGQAAGWLRGHGPRSPGPGLGLHHELRAVVHPDADVVPGAQLDDDDVGVAEPVVGHKDAHVLPPTSPEAHGVPLVRLAAGQ